MTYKQAMLANFGSACLCYLGLIVGLILGFKTSAVHYIYGIAGGMFLYISLVDMVSYKALFPNHFCGQCTMFLPENTVEK
jgi:zinc transporter ZupT